MTFRVEVNRVTPNPDRSVCHRRSSSGSRSKRVTSEDTYLRTDRGERTTASRRSSLHVHKLGKELTESMIYVRQTLASLLCVWRLVSRRGLSYEQPPRDTPRERSSHTEDSARTDTVPGSAQCLTHAASFTARVGYEYSACHRWQRERASRTDAVERRVLCVRLYGPASLPTASFEDEPRIFS